MNINEAISLGLKTLGALALLVPLVGAAGILIDQIGRRRGIVPCDPAIAHRDHPDIH